MKTIKIFALLALLLATLTVPLQAQLVTTQTTVSSAIASPSTTQIQVASTTGFVGVGSSSGLAQWGLIIDNEFMLVRLVTNTTTLQVLRAQSGTVATTHAAGTAVFAGPVGNRSPFIMNAIAGKPARAGSCVVTNEAYQPLISVVSADQYSCVASHWTISAFILNLSASGLNAPQVRAPNVAIGSVAYASMGTNATLSATVTYITSVFLPNPMNVTGVSILKGATAGADNWTVALYKDIGGLPVAQSASTAVAATGNIFQDIPFAAQYYAPGPARYWIALQSNGTTSTARMVAASTFINVLTTSVTGGTYGTFLSLTPPTTFTADVGPVAVLY